MANKKETRNEKKNKACPALFNQHCKRNCENKEHVHAYTFILLFDFLITNFAHFVSCNLQVVNNVFTASTTIGNSDGRKCF